MKKLCGLAFLLVFGLSWEAGAAARLKKQTTAIHQNDGNRRVGVSVACTSSAWTLVVAANEKRRLLSLKASDANGGRICLGTDDAGGTCVSGHLGFELGTGDNYQDSSEAALYCRAESGGGATTVVKGFDLNDSAD